MKREIKFRAWNKKSKTMFSPQEFIQDNDLRVGYYDASGFPKIGRDIILMQYTGLKDINGKEIYEGDIVETLFDGLRIVLWNKHCFEMRLLNGKQENGGVFWYFKTKIIGNIYDNHELLNNLK